MGWGGWRSGGGGTVILVLADCCWALHTHTHKIGNCFDCTRPAHMYIASRVDWIEWWRDRGWWWGGGRRVTQTLSHQEGEQNKPHQHNNNNNNTLVPSIREKPINFQQSTTKWVLASLGRTWTILRRPDGVPPAKAFNSFTPTHFSPPPLLLSLA